MVSVPVSLEQVWDWLSQVPDPEIPVISVVDLGIVRSVAWEDDTLAVTLTPTYSGCPATSVIESDIADALRRRGMRSVDIRRRIAPAWTTDWITEAGRVKLESHGIAPPQSGGGPGRCPHCGGLDLDLVSQFGSTPCKALWRCRACREPFDYFKCL